MGRRKLKITFNGSLLTPLKLSNPNELQWASHQVATFKAYMELKTSFLGPYLQSLVALEAFLSDPGVPGVRSMGPDVTPYLPTRLFADLTDVTLADEDSNLIPTDDVHRAVLGNVAMQVAPSGAQH